MNRLVSALLQGMPVYLGFLQVATKITVSPMWFKLAHFDTELGKLHNT